MPNFCYLSTLYYIQLLTDVHNRSRSCAKLRNALWCNWKLGSANRPIQFTSTAMIIIFAVCCGARFKRRYVVFFTSCGGYRTYLRGFTLAGNSDQVMTGFPWCLYWPTLRNDQLCEGTRNSRFSITSLKEYTMLCFMFPSLPTTNASKGHKSFLFA